MLLVEIKEYNDSLSKDLFLFRQQAIREGNRSLISDKFNPYNFNGKIWCCYINNNLASISAAEESHYTGDPKIAIRICRYHILKKYRHSHCGFKMLYYQIIWAKNQNYKILYWTHDIQNKALNALYQHKRTMVDQESKIFFNSDWYRQVKLDKRLLFTIDKGKTMQYVYYITFDQEFKWFPTKSVIWQDHNGDI